MHKRLANRVKLSLITAATAALSVSLPSAKAALTLVLSEPGYAPAMFVDPTNTAVSDFTGIPIPYGTFTTDIVVGSSNQNYQGSTPAQAILQIQSLQVVSTSGAGKTLTISLLETGYNFPGNPGNMEFMDSSLGGTLSPASTGDVITFDSTATTTSGVPSSNVSSGLQTYSPTGIPSGTTGFSEPDANTTWARGSSFDLSNITTITLSNVGESANLSGTTTVSQVSSGVPEPTALGIVGLAAGRLLARRSRRSAGTAA